MRLSDWLSANPKVTHYHFAAKCGLWPSNISELVQRKRDPLMRTMLVVQKATNGQVNPWDFYPEMLRWAPQEARALLNATPEGTLTGADCEGGSCPLPLREASPKRRVVPWRRSRLNMKSKRLRRRGGGRDKKSAKSKRG